MLLASTRLSIDTSNACEYDENLLNVTSKTLRVCTRTNALPLLYCQPHACQRSAGTQLHGERGHTGEPRQRRGIPDPQSRLRDRQSGKAPCSVVLNVS